MVTLLPRRWQQAVLLQAGVLLVLGLLTRFVWIPAVDDAGPHGAWIPSPLVGRAWLVLALGLLASSWIHHPAPTRAVGIFMLILGVDRTLGLLNYPSIGLVSRLQHLLAAFPSATMEDTSPIGALSLAGIGAALALRPAPRPGSHRDSLAGSILLFVVLALIPLLIGRLYGSAWSYGGLVGRVSIVMILGMLIAAGAGLALAGPQGFPTRAFVGNASRSVLLRSFIPLAVANLLLVAFFQQILIPHLGLDPAPAQALMSLFTLLIAVVIAVIAAQLVGAAADRSDEAHKQAVARLDSEHRQLTAIMDAVPVGVVVADPDGRLSHVNREAERIIGPGPHGANADEWPARYGIFLPDGKTPAPADVIPLTRALRGETVDQMEAVIRRPGTTIEVPVQAIASPIPSFDDRLQGAVMVFGDLTARRDLEARVRAAQRLEAVGQLAGGIAHDFNNLLTVILGHAELLLDRMPQDDPHRRSIASMDEAARRAAILTRRLLAFGRKQMLQPRTVELRELLTELTLPLRDAAAPDLRVELLPSPDDLHVRIDPERLSESLVSLVLNARDAATRPGLVQISLEKGMWMEPRRIGMDLLPPGRYARLAVRDDGPGMTPEVLAKALEPFFTTKPKYLGSGLGLSTVYGFIRQSGGGLAIESVPTWGTPVVMWLPLGETPALAPAPPAVPAVGAAPVSGPRTLLLAEDEPAIREMTADYLESAGWNVLRAVDGQDALAVAAAHQGDIAMLVTDIMMPHLGGVDLARGLRAQRPGLRVLFMSGFTDTPPLDDAPLLVKPFSPAELLAAINRTAG